MDSSMALRILTANGERSDTRLQPAEAAARAALDPVVCRSLADAEWARMRSKLLEFAAILRNWDRQPKPNTSS